MKTATGEELIVDAGGERGDYARENTETPSVKGN